MVDEIHTGIAPNPIHPATDRPFIDYATPKTTEPVKTEPKAAKVDHLGEIAELVRGLHNVSPSGAETIRDQILQRIADIRDPKAYDERMAKEKKAHDESVQASKKAQEEYAKAVNAEKVYVKVA